jgi:hypothetical protein
MGRMTVIDNANTAISNNIFFVLDKLGIMPSFSCRRTDRTDLYPELRRFADIENIKILFGLGVNYLAYGSCCLGMDEGCPDGLSPSIFAFDFRVRKDASENGYLHPVKKSKKRYCFWQGS